VATDPPVPSSTPPPVLEEEVPRPPYDHVGHGAVLISPCALASHGADAWGGDRLEGTPCPVFPAAAPQPRLWLARRGSTPEGGDPRQRRGRARRGRNLGAPGLADADPSSIPLKASRPLIRVLVINDNHYGLTILFEL
jgi:hypothetical protein